jgi:hypothetical protein
MSHALTHLSNLIRLHSWGQCSINIHTPHRIQPWCLTPLPNMCHTPQIRSKLAWCGQARQHAGDDAKCNLSGLIIQYKAGQKYMLRRKCKLPHFLREKRRKESKCTVRFEPATFHSIHQTPSTHAYYISTFIIMTTPPNMAAARTNPANQYTYAPAPPPCRPTLEYWTAVESMEFIALQNPLIL